jgi:tetrahydromethanopterin S-methyltransferase subunit D
MPGTKNTERPVYTGDEEVFTQSNVSVFAAEGIKGLLRITGFAMLAVIAGYSAGFANASYHDSKNRNNAPAGH